MSAPGAVVSDRAISRRSVGWAAAAVAAGLFVPWFAGRWLSNVSYSDLLTTYYILWAVMAVGAILFVLGCTWVIANRGPMSGDRLTNFLLFLMFLALAAFFFLSNIPYLGSQIETVTGVVLAPPFLDRGLLTAMAYLAFGISLAGVYGWRGLHPQTEAVESPSSARRLALRALILLVTIAAGFMALATHVEQVLRD